MLINYPFSSGATGEDSEMKEILTALETIEVGIPCEDVADEDDGFVGESTL